MRSNIKTLAALLIAGGAMTACSNNDENILEEVSQPDQPKVYTMTVEATKGDNGTRGLVLVLDDNKKILNAKWDPGEKVIVMKWDDTVDEWKEIGELTAIASETASTTLNGTLTEAPEANKTKLFLHGTSVSYDNQEGTLEYIAENCDFATAMIENIVTDETTNNITVSGIEFISQQAIVQFHFQDKGGHDLNVTKLEIEDGEGNMYKELNASTGNLQDLGHVNGSVEINYSDGTGTMFVALANVVPSSKLKLTATVPSGGDNAYTYTCENTGTTLRAGKYYDITLKMEKYVPDLSMLDCAGKTRASRWTANCYMVHTAGDYKLPLVYGNAIKAGADNTVAYNPGGTTSSTYCANFVNHAGTAINAPWITKSTSGEGVNKGMGIAVNSAELLWQDAQGLITAVGIDGDYLTLTVGKNATTQEGNALIAAKDANGTIVWSWHIWVTKEDFDWLCEVNTGEHTYQVTLVNLGWVGKANSTGYNTYYEWGRKDPFIPSTGTGNTNHTVYDINGTQLQNGYTYSTTAVSLDGHIKNPTTFYIVNTYNSSTSEANSLWDAQQTSNSNNIATATVKTVYDPCPAGFCVPTGNLYYYLLKQNGGSFRWISDVKCLLLQNYTTNVYFPASGIRARGKNGGLNYVGSYGYYWSASASANNSGHTFYFQTSSSKTWGGCYRANGFSVRAVVEETSGESPTTSPETNRSDYGKAEPIILY